METKPQISFIIVNYNSTHYIERCLSSLLLKSENIEKEIIIVSNDGSLLSVDSRIKILTSSQNSGFGSACNLGAKEAHGRYLCFLNPDTEIVSDNFQEIISEFENNEKTGVIGIRLEEENRKIQDWSAGKEINIWDIIGNNLGLKRSKKIWESEEKVECAWVSGACLFIRKDLFEKLNGFDEKFFLYFEDIDLCKRAVDLNYKILYFPKFTIKHFGGKSFGSKKEQKKHYYSSQDYYFKKHFGKIYSLMIKIIRELTF
jgi:hypothetical protein